MRLKKWHCPKCGGIAKGTSDMVPGCAELNIEKGGRADYAGETDMDWNGQVNISDLPLGVDIEGLIAAANQVTANWETGDLAAAVRALDEATERARRALAKDHRVTLQCHNGHEWETTYEETK